MAAELAGRRRRADEDGIALRPGWRGACAVLVLAVGLALLPAAAPGAGAQAQELYRVEVAVADQSDAEQQAAAGIALLTVLTRVTGLKDVPRVPEIRDALSEPRRFYTRSQYLSGDTAALPATPRAGARSEVRRPAQAEGLKLSLHFSESAIQRLVMAAGLPLWSANRPRTVIWMVEDDGERRALLDGADEHPLVLGLRRRARHRALPVVIPELEGHRDERGRSDVSVAAVWSHDWQRLAEASERYAADTILVGRVGATPTGGWSTHWRLWQREGERRFSEVPFLLETDSLERIARDTVDHVADEMFARFAIYPGEQRRLPARVTGVVSLGGYGAVLQYLRSLEFIEEVEVRRAERGALDLMLLTHADVARLREFLAFDGRLRPATIDDVRSNDRLTLEWHR